MKQEWKLFVQYIFSGIKAKNAYELVYPKGKKNPLRLFKNPKFLEYYSKEIEKLSDQSLVNRQRIIFEEAAMAFSDISQLFSWDGDTILSPSELPDSIKPAIKSYSRKRNKYTGEWDYTYKFWPKDKALERLSKLLGLYELDNKQKTGQTNLGVGITATIVCNDETKTKI